jgi:hypothetical protein
MGYSHGVRPGKESAGESLPRILGALLSADPRMASRFWAELVDPPRVRASNVTAIYCRFVSQGRTCFAVEFVAGETLEQFAGKIDPEAGEQVVPLLCTVLDSFEKRREGASNQKPARHAEGIELLDLGVIRAMAADACAPRWGMLTIEEGQINGTQMDLAGSVALFAEQKLSDSFRCASVPRGISEIVISSVLFDNESYCLPHVEQALVSTSAVEPSVSPRSLSAWWIGIGIAATLAGSALFTVWRRTPAPLIAPAAVHALPEAHQQPAPVELAAPASEVPVDQTPKRAAKRERRSFQPNISLPKQEARKSDLAGPEAAPEPVALAPPGPEETGQADSGLAETAAVAATPVKIQPKEAATENEAEQGTKKKPGRFRRVIGKVFSLGRQKKDGALSRVPAESVAHKQE